MKHTQGTWEIDPKQDGQWWNVGLKNTPICTIRIDDTSNGADIAMANAQLIAAAPVMYDALLGDEAKGVPNAQLVLIEVMLGNYDAVKAMLREMCSVHAAAMAKATT